MSSEESPFDDVRCPMPVIRELWDEERGVWRTELGICGEPLYVSYTTDAAIQRAGEQVVCGTTWEVICVAQHVLLRPDYQGDDNFDRIPFERRFLDEVLARFDSQRPSVDKEEEK